jgi:hypothetical protein
MKRRTLLKGVIGGTAIGFSGCLNQGSDIAGGKNKTDPDETDNNTDKAKERDTDSGGGGNNENSSGESTDNSNDGNDGGNSQTGDSSGDSTDETTPSKPKPALVNSSFEIVSAGCGTNSGKINTSFTDHTVRITGSIRGKNSCYTAKLKDTSFEQRTLTVTVRSFETKSSDTCAMCLKNIEYESTHTFEGGLPKRVVIIHNGTQMTSMKRKNQ